jgi:FAD/FMN-containing dehydrogenase
MFDEDDPEALKAYELFTRKFASGVLKMGGSPVSTLGVGLRLVDTVESMSQETQMRLMRRVKRSFDPENLLNPGKKLKAR